MDTVDFFIQSKCLNVSAAVFQFRVCLLYQVHLSEESGQILSQYKNKSVPILYF